MNDVERFVNLFSGLDRAYGQWAPTTGKVRFIKNPVTPKQWENHVKGVMGLGIVPITEDDTCTWGALDIDVDDIDHGKLVKLVKNFNLPLIVCRSKSGGAHCHTFINTPVKAEVLRKALAKFAAKLGFGQCEVFPKQDTLGDGLGSWINLPYFAGNETNRYAVDDAGEPMSFEDFLVAAESLKESTTPKSLRAEAKDTKGMPPCLSYFMVNGIPEGARNEILFNFAAFLKKSSPDHWEEEFMRINSTLPVKPLPNREAQTLIKSVAKKDYNYKCKVPLIANQCDRINCLTLDFGIRDNSHYHEFIMGGITKITTDPPFWILDVNGTDVRLTTAQIFSFTSIRMRCMEVFGGMIPPMKDEEWRQLLQQKLSTVLAVQEAPKDAGETGRVMSGLMEFARMAGRSRKREDVAHGMPVLDNMEVIDPSTEEKRKSAVVLFRSSDFIAYLQRKKIIAFLPNADLWAVLRDAGCGHIKVRVGKRIIQAWYLPLTPEQVEDIKAATAMPEMKEHEL